MRYLTRLLIAAVLISLTSSGLFPSQAVAEASHEAAQGGVVSQQGGAPRIGHVSDPIDDVEQFAPEVEEVAPRRHLRTIDITRFGYHLGQKTAKFTTRTRDLRAVPGAPAMFIVDVTTRSRAATEEFTVYTARGRVGVELNRANRNWRRPCAEATYERDASRNTVTFRVPMRCLSGKSSPTSMQLSGRVQLAARGYGAIDQSSRTRRIDVR